MENENRVNNKRKSFNQDNQEGGKFRKSQNFGNRTPFKGNNKSPFNKSNQGGNRSFNRNSNGPFNKGPRKSWQNKSNDGNSRSLDEDLSVESKQKNINKTNLNEKKVLDVVSSSEQSESSESDEVVTKLSLNDLEASESEEVETVKTIKPKVNESKMTNESDDSDSSEDDTNLETSINSSQNNSKISNSNANDTDSSESDEEIDLTEMDDSPITLSVCKDNSSSNASKHTSDKSNVVTEEQKNCTIMVKNVPPFITGEHLEAFFSRYGKIKFVKALSVQTIFICFERPEDAIKALEVNGMEYKKHYIIVSMWRDQTPFHEKDFNNAVVVKNIPFEMVNVNSLHPVFAQCGTIVELNTFANAGCAYIWFDSANSVELALEMNNTQLASKSINVEVVDVEMVKASRERKLTNQKLHFQQNKFNGKRRNVRRPVKSGFIKKRN